MDSEHESGIQYGSAGMLNVGLTVSILPQDLLAHVLDCALA